MNQWVGRSDLKRGEGLGKNGNGVTDCVQITRREETAGLGFKPKNETLDENYWENIYNKTIENVKASKNGRKSSNAESNQSGLINDWRSENGNNRKETILSGKCLEKQEQEISPNPSPQLL